MMLSESKLKIVADENIPMALELFGHLGEINLVAGRNLSRAHVRDADILLVRSVTQVNKALLADSKVRFVGTATIGIDHIDVEYLESRGIEWSSAPGCNAESVAEYVISAFCRIHGLLEWILLNGRVGIVGMGNVGGQLYRKLSALGINCVGYDPLIDQSAYPHMTDLESVLRCDVICLHTPLTRDGIHPTFHMLGERALDKLAPGTLIVNAGRGEALDNAALKEALYRRDDLAVVLDVWENEPNIDIDLMQRVDYCTPHIAGYSLDGKLAGTRMIHRACCDFLKIEPSDVDIDALNSTSECRIRVKLGQSTADSIRQTVLSCYDIARDDQRMRGHLLHCEDSSKAEAFDLLRKNYPQRREFSQYTISNFNELDKPVANALTALGFKNV